MEAVNADALTALAQAALLALLATGEQPTGQAREQLTSRGYLLAGGGLSMPGLIAANKLAK
jgi:hypothetical protein